MTTGEWNTRLDTLSDLRMYMSVAAVKNPLFIVTVTRKPVN